MHGGGLHHLIDDGIFSLDAKVGFQFLIGRDVGTGTNSTAEVNRYPIRFLVSQRPDNPLTVA